MGRLVLLVLGIVSVWAVRVAPAQASPSHRASMSIGYGGFIIDDDTAPIGGVVNLDYERFFSDALAVRVGAGGGYYFADEDSYSAHAVIGGTYLIDNLKYVPYGTVGIGGLMVSDERVESGFAMFVEVGGGLDVMVSPSLAVGVTFKFEAQPARLSFFTGGARVVYRWGY